MGLPSQVEALQKQAGSNEFQLDYDLWLVHHKLFTSTPINHSD